MPRGQRWLPLREYIEARIRFWDTRSRAFEVPPTNIDEAPYYCLRINQQWWPHIVGTLAPLQWSDRWLGTEEDIDRALQSIMMLEIPNTNCEGEMTNCCPTDVVAVEAALADLLAGTELSILFPNVPQNIGDPSSNGLPSDQARIGRFASCRAFQEWVGGSLLSMADTVETATEIAAALAILIFPGSFLAPAVTFAIGFSVEAELKDLADNTEAIAEWSCCMSSMLQGQPLTHAAFKQAVCRCDAPGDVDFILQSIMCQMAKSRDGWFRYLTLLDEHYAQTIINDVDRILCESPEPCVGEYDFISQMPASWFFTEGQGKGKWVPGIGAQSIPDEQGIGRLDIQMALEPGAGDASIAFHLRADGEGGDLGNSLRFQEAGPDGVFTGGSNMSIIADGELKIVTWEPMSCSSSYLRFVTLDNVGQNVIDLERVVITPG